MIFLVWILAFIISTIVITFHLSALNKATPLISQIGNQKSIYKRLLITSYILLIHCAEIIMFGILFFMLVNIDGAGEVIGAVHVRDYFYFSAANYTSLGYGDLYPQGYIRIFSGVEALVGLIMIGWTVASPLGISLKIRYEDKMNIKHENASDNKAEHTALCCK